VKKKMNKEQKWFVERLERNFGVNAEPERISPEGYEFYHEELDEEMITAEMLRGLPDPLLLETLLYIDAEGNEWLGVIGVELETRVWLIQVVLKNGETLLTNKLVKENDKK
jgi:hypothetical protein